MGNNIFKIRSASILLIAAGYGWAGGHFIPTDSPLVAYSFQFVIIIFLLIFGVGFLGLPDTRMKGHWSIRGLSVFSVVSLLLNILNIIRGTLKSGNFTYGSHNTFADLVPITLILFGAVMWLSVLGRSIAKTAGATG